MTKISLKRTRIKEKKNKQKQKTKTKKTKTKNKNLHLPTVRTLATCHPRANIICVETLLKFVQIPFGELVLERCHVDIRSNCKRKLIPQGHNTIKKTKPCGIQFCNVWELTKGDPQMIWWWDGSGEWSLKNKIINI